MPERVESFAGSAKTAFGFRPWVRRAGLSIIAVSLLITVVVAAGAALHAAFRFGWAREPFVWAYIGTLWLGGAKVFFGTFYPVAEVDGQQITLRPLHHLRAKTIRWDAIRGTEQMIGGDRLIVYHATARGMRFVALNLNLVKGRRDFLALLDKRLLEMGFVERVVERSRYLSAPGIRDSG